VQVPLCLPAYGHHLGTSWQGLQFIAVLSPAIMQASVACPYLVTFGLRL
jgi:hypothetical protein